MTNTNEQKTIGGDATKDSGRVKIGAGAIDFSDQGRKQDVTKDSGRVRFGAGAITF